MVQSEVGADRLDILSTETTELFKELQTACNKIDGGAARLGLLDLVIVGQEASGKSSFLSGLTSLKLPTGVDGRTRNPVRINLSNSGSEVRLKTPDGEWRALKSEGLDNGTYVEALSKLQSRDPGAATNDAVVSEELVMEVGREGHPSLSIVDLPGLVINYASPRSEPIAKLNASFLVPSKDDGSCVLPICVSKASTTLACMQTGPLLQGREFVTVLTHIGELLDISLTEDKFTANKAQISGLWNLKRELEQIGCRGLFLVQAPDGDEVSAEWYRAIGQGLPTEQKLLLSSMCGIAAVKKGLQELQFNHMLSHHADAMERLRARLNKIAPSLKMINLTDKQLEQDFCGKLQQIQRDVELSFEGRKRLLETTCEDIPENHQLDILAGSILNDFSLRTHEHILEEVREHWKREATSTSINSACMTDWVKDGCNQLDMIVKATSDMFKKDFAAPARSQLKRELQSFLEWRFEDRMLGWGEARAGFARFLTVYLQDKDELLIHEAAMMYDEAKTLKLTIHSPFARCFFMDNREGIEAMAERLLQCNLHAQESNRRVPDRSLLQSLMDYHKLSEDLSDTHVKILVLTFFKASEAMERIAARMISVLFYWTFEVEAHQVTLNDSSLVSLTLEHAFRKYCNKSKAAGNSLNFKEWALKGADSIQQEHAALQRAIDGLERFSDRASKARRLGVHDHSTAAGQRQQPHAGQAPLHSATASYNQEDYGEDDDEDFDDDDEY